MSKIRLSTICTTLLLLAVATQSVIAVEYTYDDPGDITGTYIELDGLPYSRPGLDTFPDPASSLGPYGVHAALLTLDPESPVVSVMLVHGPPGGDPLPDVPAGISDGVISASIPMIDPVELGFDYCAPAWQYGFYLLGSNDTEANAEIDERHYADGSGGDPYLFQIANPDPNQPPVSDLNGPYDVDRWEDLVADGSGSSDPEAGLLEYEWDVWADWTDYEETPYVWDDEFDDGTGANPTFNFVENGEYHIRLLVRDECGEEDVAETTIQVYDPHVVVIRDEDHIAALNWRDDLYLTLSINATVISTKSSEYLDGGDGFGQNWEPSEIGFDVVAGMEVTITSSDGTIRSHTVRDHRIDDIDFDSDTVTGWSLPGTYVRVRVDDPYWVEIVATADSTGTWVADFDLVGVDLVQELQVNVVQQNEWDSSHTLVFSEVPPELTNSIFTVQPDHGWVHAQNWPLNANITLTVDVDDNPETDPIYSETRPTVPAEWDPNVSEVEFDGLWDLLARGLYVSMSDGETTKHTWIADLHFDEMDPEAGIASGQCLDCSDGTVVRVNIQTDHENDYGMETIVDSSGDWNADFGAEFGDPNFSNITDASVVVWDVDGDETMAHLPEPEEPQNPRFTIQPDHRWADGNEWPEGTPVTITIDDDDDHGNGFKYQDTQMPGPAPWDQNQIVAVFNFEEVEVERGDYVSMTNGITTKDTWIADLYFDAVDLGEDTASGRGPAGAMGGVGIETETDGYWMEITVNSYGDWTADFFTEFGDPDFTNITDANVVIWDDDGDETMVHTPPPEFVAGSFSPNPVMYGEDVTITADFLGHIIGVDDCTIAAMEYIIWPATDWMEMPVVACDTVATGTVVQSIDEPGVYSVVVRAVDSIGAEAGEFLGLLAVYDPDGGFVTGGGWITSPEGAYYPDPSLTGKASFGFVARYKRGANVPSGRTEFQFRVADLNFRSTSYDWLVVAGRKAMFKGVGTINGEGEYKFMLSAIDGDLQGGDGLDRFRIRIWYEDDFGNEIVVYDNQLGDWPDAEPSTELGGGSIVIHKSK